MAQFEIRPCERGDMAAVADLLLREASTAPGVTAGDVAAYAEHIYFDNPWADAELPSLVCTDAGGELEGFVGVLPRRMRLGEAELRVAAPGNFVVRAGPDGKVNAFAALAMIRRLFGGPQDLTYTDTANDASRRLWESAGAINPGLQSLDWRRPIQPMTALLQMMGGERSRAAAAAALMTRVLDLAGAPALAWLHRRTAQGGPPPARLAPLATGEALDLLRRRERGEALVPAFDVQGLEWLFHEIEVRAAGRRLLRHLVQDEKGATIGAFVVLVERSGMARALMHVARDGRGESVLQAMVDAAAAQGATLLGGAVQPRQMPALKAQRCFMLCREWTLVHSRRPEIIQAFQMGEVRLTGLEGERWTRFNDLFWI